MAAQDMPRPWERYLPSVRADMISARHVQRDFNRLIRQLGTPTTVPKPRNRAADAARGRAGGEDRATDGRSRPESER